MKKHRVRVYKSPHGWAGQCPEHGVIAYRKSWADAWLRTKTHVNVWHRL